MDLWRRRPACTTSMNTSQHAAPRAAELPIFGPFAKPGRDRVLFRVADEPLQARNASHEMIERLPLPERAGAPKQPVCLMSGETLPRVHDLVRRGVRQRCQ